MALAVQGAQGARLVPSDPGAQPVPIPLVYPTVPRHPEHPEVGEWGCFYEPEENSEKRMMQQNNFCSVSLDGRERVELQKQ